MIRVAVLIVGDKENSNIKTVDSDLIREILESFEGKEEYKKVVPEDFRTVQEELFNITERGLADLVLTIGGTGFARKNITPEATMAVIEKETPGIPELMRQEIAKKLPNVVLSRGRAGIRKSTLIINLPDRKAEIIESFNTLSSVIPEGIKILQRDYTDQRYRVLKLW